jgi:hypothetical protein
MVGTGMSPGVDGRTGEPVDDGWGIPPRSSWLLERDWGGIDMAELLG